MARFVWFPWPFHRYEVRTDLSRHQVVQTLERAVSGAGPSHAGSYDGAFLGRYSDNEFLIHRRIWYSNSFLPLIRGHIANSQQGTLITIRMRMYLLVIAFLIIWFSGALIGCAVTVYAVVTQYDTKLQFAYLLPFALLAGGLALYSLPFSFEVLKAKRILSVMFEAPKDPL